MNLRLIEPSIESRREFLAMVVDYRAAGECRYDLAYTNFTEYLRRLERNRVASKADPAHIPGTEYWLMDDSGLAGCIRVRFKLPPAQEKEGGHIGYDIRPSRRRLGYGVELLRLGILCARQNHGIRRIRITCDAANLASRKIIERNGGVLAGEALSDYSGQPILQYWIEPSS